MVISTVERHRFSHPDFRTKVRPDESLGMNATAMIFIVRESSERACFGDTQTNLPAVMSAIS